MKKADILSSIKETEKKAEKLKTDAVGEKENIIKNSKREALNIVDRAKQDAQKSYDEKIEQMQKEIEEIKRKTLAEGTERAKKLKTKADANRGRAINLLMQKFEQEVE